MTRLDLPSVPAGTAPALDGPDGDTALGRYALAMSSDDLARRLFGADLELLRDVPGTAALPVVSRFDDATLDRIADVEALVTGWGTPQVTAEVLERLPRLTTVIHAGGSTESVIAADVRPRLQRSNAGAVNAVPVAEYSLAMILLACKQVFAAQRIYRQRRERIDREEAFPDAGVFGQTVGIVGASRIGRRTLELLRPFDLRILVSDPFVSAEEIAALGAEKVSLAELLGRSDVVSIHAPLNEATRGMIGADELALMPAGATLLNTARGGVVDLPALETELVSGRLEAILDVTDPFEPLPADSPLWECENVVITPHVAGSMGTELQRMGRHVAAELGRALRGEPLAVSESSAGR